MVSMFLRHVNAKYIVQQLIQPGDVEINGTRTWDIKVHDRRMWDFYLLSCAGAARARQIQLWQIVFSHGNLSVYDSVR